MKSTPPVLRLFVLHHAGGSHLLYRTWPAGLPDTWDVRLLDAPGHGHLLDLPRITDVGDLAEFLLRDIGPDPACPYALFGHSMGAVLAYEITRRLVDRGLPAPVWIGVSAHAAPQSTRREDEYQELSGAGLRTYLKLMGGTPDEVLDDPDLWELFEPIIRADLRLVDTWRPAPDAGPLPVALSAYAGTEDHSAAPPRMAGWQEHTGQFLGLRAFDGGHFYFVDDPGPLLRQIERDVSEALHAARTGAPGPAAGRL
ncbi:thioesterase II family protein [Streptomyces sp. NPDC002499]